MGAILIDLSKAFDSLPHGLLVAKLYAYGLSQNACKLIVSYLSDRQQRVKLQNYVSDWKTLKRGVPQGSLMGPLLFNIFLNDIFLFLDNHCTIHNYADDNTLSYHHKNPTVVKNVLESATDMSLTWFHNNYMQANPEKFQSIVLCRNDNTNLRFNINGHVIEPSCTVKLLGVHLDKDLNFNYHVKEICKKASKQLNAMCRMSRFLSKDSLINVFNSFFMSNFNYCPLVWHLCGIGNTRKLEKLHKRALRIITNDYDSTYYELLEMHRSLPLYVYRSQRLALFVCKVLNDECKPISANFYEVIEHNYQTRSERTLKCKNYHTVKYGFNSVRHQGAILWNSLPTVIKNRHVTQEFKESIKLWDGAICNCGFCLRCSIVRI